MLNKVISFNSDSVFSRRTEIMKALEKGPESWRYIEQETRLVQEAVMLMMSDRLEGTDRLAIVSSLERFGVLVHGNLNPDGKAFKPEKIIPFDFHHKAPEMRVSLLAALQKATQYKQQLPGLDKRGALIATLSMNVTLKNGTRKSYAIPVHTPTTPILSIAAATAKELNKNGHAETAFWHHLSQEKTVNQLLLTLKDVIRKDSNPATTIDKLNAIVVHLSGSYEMCDSCHDGSSTKLQSGISSVFEKIARTLKIRVPKNAKGIAMAMQYTYAFSPSEEHSGNHYSKPPVFDDKRVTRANFHSGNVIIQRRMGKFDSIDPDHLSPYTLFVSNGPDYDERHQWFFTGNVTNLNARSGACSRCTTKIQYEFEIQHYLSGETAVIGSECIKKYPTSYDVLDHRDLVVEDKEHRKSIVSGQKNHLETISNIKTAIGGDAAVTPEVQQVLDNYLLNGFFSWKEAALILSMLNTPPKLKIEEVEGEPLASFSLTELIDLEQYFLNGTKKQKTVLPRIQTAIKKLEDKKRRAAEQARIDSRQGFLKRISAKIASNLNYSNWHLDEHYTKYKSLTLGYIRFIVEQTLSADEISILEALTLKPPTDEQLQKLTASQYHALKRVLPRYYELHAQKLDTAPLIRRALKRPAPASPLTSSTDSPPPTKVRRVIPPTPETPKKKLATLRSWLYKLKKNPHLADKIKEKLYEIKQGLNSFSQETIDPLLRALTIFREENQGQYPNILSIMLSIINKIENKS